MLSRLAIAAAFGFFWSIALLASPPNDPAERAVLVGHPVKLIVEPAEFVLSGPRDVRQLVVTGVDADGRQRDLTALVSFGSSDAKIATVEAGGFVRSLADGAATISVKAGQLEASAKVTIKDFTKPKPVSFRHDVVAAMNVGGCNMGACHGTPSGKNGFKLSLRGFDPAADYVQLTREQYGRRTDAHDAEQALMILKGQGRVPHEGGSRWTASSLPLEMVREWHRQGLQDDASTLPAVKSLAATPKLRVMHAPTKWQQVSVNATFADGTARDVTRLTNFSSSDLNVAEVNSHGLVEFKRPGEVAILARYLEEMVSVRLTYLEPKPDFKWPNPPAANYVDEHVFRKLQLMQIAPSELCTDTEFLRRATLDTIGRLPTLQEAKDFAASTSTKKRAELIDRLVVAPEFADFWALKWADVLRSSRKTIQLKGSAGMQQWLRQRFRDNEPFDKIVRELLTASGNTYSEPAANYYRIAKDPTGLAESTAQLFLGARMQCAKCHNHPFERWSQDDYYGLAAVFARVKVKPAATQANRTPNPQESAEVVVVQRDGEVTQPRTGRAMPPRFPGSGEQNLPPGTDRRAAFAEWLTQPGNATFTKSVANRVWFHLLGRGIVDPVDDFRESNPSANDELLEALAADFAKSKFDLRKLVATILNSRTYQLSALPNETNRDDSKYFAKAIAKLLPAEPLLDAICDVSGVPEKFAGLPAGTRAVQLPDGEVNHPFLKTFGQPARELACECERESEGSLAQALLLINGPTLNEKVRNPNNRLGELLTRQASDEAQLDELYLIAFSRKPDAEEAKIALSHVAAAKDRRKGWEDVLWALLNTREFLFRH